MSYVAAPPAPSTVAPPPLQSEARRAQLLRAGKRRATGLLLVMGAAFLAAVLLTDDSGWTGYLRAGLEASLVGGLADWFAVTALFRHPLGVPIPHTAVIKERKDQFGDTLGEFVQENFLSADAIGERVRASNAIARVADWLIIPENARTVSGRASEIVVSLADLVREEDVHELVDTEIRRAIENVQLAPLAGRVLGFATADGRHQELLDAVLRSVHQYLDDHRESLRERFGARSPWWLPGAVEDRLFDRLADGFGSLLQSVNDDPNHELRVVFDERVKELVVRLQHDPELLARGEALKQDLLAHPELRVWTASLWTDLKAGLRTQADDPDSPLRRRITDGVIAAATRLRDDPVLQERGGAARRLRRRVGRRALPGRARVTRQRHDRTLGRRRDLAAARAAARARPAVHPHQRDDRRRTRRPRDPRDRASALIPNVDDRRCRSVRSRPHARTDPVAMDRARRARRHPRARRRRDRRSRIRRGRQGGGGDRLVRRIRARTRFGRASCTTPGARRTSAPA